MEIILSTGLFIQWSLFSSLILFTKDWFIFFPPMDFFSQFHTRHTWILFLFYCLLLVCGGIQLVNWVRSQCFWFLTKCPKLFKQGVRGELANTGSPRNIFVCMRIYSYRNSSPTICANKTCFLEYSWTRQGTNTAEPNSCLEFMNPFCKQSLAAFDQPQVLLSDRSTNQLKCWQQ